MERVGKAICNFKIHFLAIVITIIAELIGTKTFAIPGVGTLVVIPLLYSFVMGALCCVKCTLMSKEDMFEASSLVGVTFFLLMARYGTLVGPSFWKVIENGPALILQEFGNLGTVLLGIPIAVLLGLRREAIGAAFSNAREPNIAIIGEKYGINSPEGLGVMGVYVTGTVFGAVFTSFMVGFIADHFAWFSPQSLAMATGTGSAGMMSAGVAALVARFPDLKDEIAAYGAASNMLSGLDGTYMCVFISLPLANWLLRVFGVKDKPSVPDAEIEQAAADTKGE